jgi:predicted phosphodiesterase
MRIAILSDVHGNLTALAEVAGRLREDAPDLAIVAGDLCLDGPSPAEVVDMVRAAGWVALKGNTDAYLASLRDEGAARAAGKNWPALAWTQAALGDERLAYLDGLDLRYELAMPEPAAGLLATHANPLDLEQKLWPATPAAEVKRLLAGVAAGTFVHGHIHIPSVRYVGRWRLVNVSSVGQPKDGDRRAAYSLFTWRDDGWQVEQRRVAYDVAAVERAIRQSGMPEAEQQIATLRRARYA